MLSQKVVAERRPGIFLSLPQNLIAHRLFEIQGGILTLMREASNLKRAAFEAKQRYNEEFGNRKVKGEKTPEEAALFSTEGSDVLREKAEARAQKAWLTEIIKHYNDFLLQFDAEVRPADQEDRDARQYRTRKSVSTIFSSTLEVQVYHFTKGEGKQNLGSQKVYSDSVREIKEGDFVVIPSFGEIYSFRKSSTISVVKHASPIEGQTADLKPQTLQAILTSEAPTDSKIGTEVLSQDDPHYSNLVT